MTNNYVRVLSDRCQGHAKCTLVAPSMFDLDADGYAVFVGPSGPPDETTSREVLKAAQACPEEAIALKTTGGPAAAVSASPVRLPTGPDVKHLRCPCGEVLVGENEDAIVANAQAHLAAVHPGLSGYTREQILVMAY